MKVDNCFLLHHGGKWNMAKKIIARFPPHKIYVEPFCGSCAVLLQKDKSFVEVINDIDDIIVNIFRTLREHPLELAAKIWAMPYAKSNFSKNNSDCDIENAAIEIAKAKQFYLGNQSTSTFSLDSTAAPHKTKSAVWSSWHNRILPAAARLKECQILQEDATDTIKRFSKNEDALIYIDPPYFGHEKEYRHQIDYEKLIHACVGAKAKIVVSEFANGESLWPKDWVREQIVVTGRSASGAHKKTKKNIEYLIFNFNPTPQAEKE